MKKNPYGDNDNLIKDNLKKDNNILKNIMNIVKLFQ